MPDYLARTIAASGLMSRRAAARAIQSGRVQVGGMVVTDVLLPLPEDAPVMVDGRPLPAAPPVVIAKLYKPRGAVTSARAESTRPLAKDFLPELPGVRWFSAGRLDAESEGLLIFTNCGALAHALEAPERAIAKRYLVETSHPLSPADRERMTAGFSDAGELLAAHSVTEIAPLAYEFTLTEGKRHEVRRMVQMARSTVRRLTRIAVGPVTLGKLAPGEWCEPTPEETVWLMAQWNP